MSDYHVFCDESHTDGHAFRVQGGVWVDHAGIRKVREAMRELRAKHPKAREFKWSEVHGREPYRSYADLVSIFFQGTAAQHLSFKCLVVRKQDDRSRTNDKSGRDLGFYKAYHLLLKHRLRPGCRYRIRLDKRTGPRRDAEQSVADCLNAEMRWWNPPSEVKSCVGICSKSDDLMQMADILCGAVAWDWNGRKSLAPAKVALADQIIAALEWPDLARETNGTAEKFNVWRYRPRTQKQVASVAA